MCFSAQSTHLVFPFRGRCVLDLKIKRAEEAFYNLNFCVNLASSTISLCETAMFAKQTRNRACSVNPLFPRKGRSTVIGVSENNI